MTKSGQQLSCFGDSLEALCSNAIALRRRISALSETAMSHRDATLPSAEVARETASYLQRLISRVRAQHDVIDRMAARRHTVAGASNNMTTQYHQEGVEATTRFSCGDQKCEASVCLADVTYLLARVSKIVIPTSTRPEVSVIISSCEAAAHVIRCLESIAEFPPSATIEVIVSSNASSPPELSLLDEIRGVRLLRNDAKVGAIASRNVAAGYARGEYLLFLHADSQVRDRWLDRLLAIFHSRSDAGIVGPKILFADGSLRQAGAIVMRDGSLLNYGEFDDPGLPQYNYFRETDYISDSILVNAELFRRIGGYDAYECPGCYADADLAFKCRAAGLKVYYQPASGVVDYKSVSHRAMGTYVTRQFQDASRFYAHWKHVLDYEHVQKFDSMFTARERSSQLPCMLVIDHAIPQPDRDAGSRSMMHFIEAYRTLGINVKFWSQSARPDGKYEQNLRELGIEVFYGGQYNKYFNEWMRQNGEYIDFVFLSRPSSAIDFIDAIRTHSNAKILYYGHDIHFLRLQQHLDLEPDNETLRLNEQHLREVERRVWKLVDVIYYPSVDESSYIENWLHEQGLKGTVRVIPAWGYDSFPDEPASNLGQRQGLLFVAGFNHPPNVDAAKWLVKEIMPLVLSTCPDAHLWLVGSNPPVEVLALKNAHTTTTGFISDEDLAHFYRNARLAIAPLRFGGGLKGKVAEAMRHGLPMITTPIGAQGLSAVEDCLVISESVEAFAKAVISLIKDDRAWRELSLRSQTAAREMFSAEAVRRALAQDVAVATLSD